MCLVPQGACHIDMDIIMSGIIGRQSQRSMRKLTGQTEKALVGHVTHPRLFCDRVQLAVGLDPFACRKAHSSRSNKTGLVYPERCLDRGVEGRDSTGAKRRRANEDASCQQRRVVERRQRQREVWSKDIRGEGTGANFFCHRGRSRTSCTP